MQDILIIGGGGHAKSIIDSLRGSNKFHIIGYTDRKENGAITLPYLGDDDVLANHYKNGVTCAVMGIGFAGSNCEARQRLFAKAKEIGYRFPTIIDPTAAIASDATIDDGTFIGKHAVVNAQAVVDCDCIINTGAIVEHDCRVGKGSHLAVGAVLCGGATIGETCLIGANATVIQGVRVGDNAVVGAGSVVLHDVPDNTTVVGIPAKTVK